MMCEIQLFISAFQKKDTHGRHAKHLIFIFMHLLRSKVETYISFRHPWRHKMENTVKKNVGATRHRE